MNFQQLNSSGLFDAIVEVVRDEAHARVVLASIGYPRAGRPKYPRGDDWQPFWTAICTSIEDGVLSSGRDLLPLVEAIARRYPAHPLLGNHTSRNEPRSGPILASGNPSERGIIASRPLQQEEANKLAMPPSTPMPRDPSSTKSPSPDVSVTRVFVSYCRENIVEAGRLRQDLIAYGIGVWWDQDLLAGQDWKYEVRKAMKQSCAVILCLSGQCLQRSKSYIYPEAYDAIAAYRQRRPGEIFLIPVRFSPCEIPSIEIDDTRTLDRLVWVDLFPADKWTEGVHKIVESVKSSLPPMLTHSGS
jgi:hypothetical protein